MNNETFSRRRFVNAAAMALGTMGLPACGGGGSGSDAKTDKTTSGSGVASSTPAPSPAPAPTPAPVSVPAPSPVAASPADAMPTAANEVTRLAVQSSATGSRNFIASVFPLQGQVPVGKTLVSLDDATLSCTVLSRWNDGSAAVLLASGTASTGNGLSSWIRLQLAAQGLATSALTATQVGRALTAVKLDFGALGIAQMTDFASPDRIWWATAQSICARYRLRAPNHATLEAVVDVHAFADGRALVEIVVENARMVTISAVRPANADYVAVAWVNGVQAGSARSADAPGGTHSPFRAWYASAWVGGDPGLMVSQLHTDLQKHPTLFRVIQPGGDMSAYAADAYTPWTAGRLRPQYMGGAGDHPSIGPIPLWDARFLQTGSAAAANAVQVSTLAALSYNVSYRDETTGLVPDAAQLVWQSQTWTWPKNNEPDELRGWEVAHHPASGLMAFACRPSPIFIEIAQRVAAWNATWGAGGPGSANLLRWSGTGIEDGTGVFGYYYQPRGRAWCIRSLVHATFLSPDGSKWKEGGRTWLNLNRLYLDEWRKMPAARAVSMPWGNGPDEMVGLSQTWPWPPWQMHFLIAELHKAAATQLLSGSQQTALESLADWVAEYPIRWVNEQPNGGWRYHPYQQLIPCDANGVVPSNWAALMATLVTAPPTSVAGTWYMTDGSSTEYANFFGEAGAGGDLGYYYISVWWAAFVAAVERNIAGSATAWDTVQRNVTNLQPWLVGFGGNPRFGAAPRRIGGVAV